MGLLVSIIVTNYNYDRFLAAAIDSALGQTYPGVEVIVVDDGSTDRSQAIIEGYGDRVIPVIKANGGMGSAFNAGFARSHGEIVLFLDSDDLLLPGTVEATVAMFRSAGVAKVHWPLWEIDAEGEWMDRVVPQGELGQGDFREVTISLGPDRYLSAPTSGNAWSRRFLESVLPVPEADFRQHADTYLYTLAPIFGTVRRLAEPGGCYRVHGRNDYACRPADEKHRRNLVVFDRRAAALEKYLAAKGIAASSDAWRGHNPYYIWLQRLQLAAQEIKAIVPEGERFILVDENQ
jgi:glycosyltransferase involved in cell wall biosynthesis